MGLFRKRKTRATRRAEAKALKHKAKLEAKHGARNDRKKLRSETKSAKKVEKAQLATLKAQEKAASKTGITASQVKRYLGIARLLTPVLLPLVYRGTVLARTQLDQQRAHRLGVAPEELGAYTGHGARLSARIAGAERTADEIARCADLRRCAGISSAAWTAVSSSASLPRTAAVNFAVSASGCRLAISSAVRSAPAIRALRRAPCPV